MAIFWIFVRVFFNSFFELIFFWRRRFSIVRKTANISSRRRLMSKFSSNASWLSDWLAADHSRQISRPVWWWCRDALRLSDEVDWNTSSYIVTNLSTYLWRNLANYWKGCITQKKNSVNFVEIYTKFYIVCEVAKSFHSRNSVVRLPKHVRCNSSMKHKLWYCRYCILMLYFYRIRLLYVKDGQWWKILI